MNVDREVLLERAKEAVSETGLPAHVIDALVTELHNRIYWPEIEKLQAPRQSRKTQSRSPREIRVIRARTTDPNTSKVAASMQSSDKSGRLYRAIIAALGRFGPLTDDELRIKLKPFLDAHNYAQESVTKRRGELRDSGIVRDSGETRKSDVGAPMKVWELVEEMS